ncbi:hypothetical protein F6V25_05750 [Oryzomonas japonica]|uniref:Uncharacterized protein n=1 Tax=Oryzomonas japonica TaxID=2603858 RepID=A0A7J4ZSE4_9BACT|nr:hypothetical protein [Oryzomonas japonica]KAB0665983.1 hypothetical protein F6V25_05750 [Oryzomonas japonica]
MTSERLIQELAIGFLSLDGKSICTIKIADKVINAFCERFRHQISTLENVTHSHLEDFLTYLKQNFQTRQEHEQKKHPWLSLFHSFKQCFSNIISKEKWPYIPRVRNTVNGHTPYAMKMMLIALRAEIDRIRSKMDRCEEAVTNGRILSFKYFEESLNSKKQILTKTQLKELETQLNNIALDLEYRSLSTLTILAKKWEVGISTLSKWKRQLKINKWRKDSKLAAFSEKQLEILRKDLFPSPRLMKKELAIKFGISTATIAEYEIKFARGLRPTELVEEISITKEDVVATICHYLPGWPLQGHIVTTRKVYQCYEVPSGILIAEFEDEADAKALALKIHGFVKQSNNNKSEKPINPGEKILRNFSYRTNLGKHLRQLFPNYAREITELYFPTTYDWTCILLYWCCKTGWNQETIRSVNVFQLMQVMKGNSTLSAFSRKHVSIKGEKTRSQPDSKPAIFVHVSDQEDKYGLYRVIADYYEFSKRLRPYLKGDEINCILTGFRSKNNRYSLTMFGPSESCCPTPFASSMPVTEFFNRNPIFEDEGESERIKTTNSMKLRTSYESALEFMGIPLMLRAFIFGHKTWDTTTSYYGSDTVSSTLQNEKIRVHLDTLSEKAFKGELKRYEQVKKENGDNVVQLFTHMGNDIFVCWNNTKPTWEGHEKRISGGHCDIFCQCLQCKQSCVTEDSLPYIVRWQWDIEEWKKEASFADFPVFMYKRYQAICEIIEMCRKDEYWQTVLDNAQDKALDENFFVPPIWSAI